jgi:hypothetical protein
MTRVRTEASEASFQGSLIPEPSQEIAPSLLSDSNVGLRGPGHPSLVKCRSQCILQTVNTRPRKHYWPKKRLVRSKEKRQFLFNDLPFLGVISIARDLLKSEMACTYRFAANEECCAASTGSLLATSSASVAALSVRLKPKANASSWQALEGFTPVSSGAALADGWRHFLQEFLKV